MTLKEQKLKANLIDTITQWIDNAYDKETYIHDSCAEDMGDAAFAVFLAIKRKEEFLRTENMIKE